MLLYFTLGPFEVFRDLVRGYAKLLCNGNLILFDKSIQSKLAVDNTLFHTAKICVDDMFKPLVDVLLVDIGVKVIIIPVRHVRVFVILSAVCGVDTIDDNLLKV